MKPPKVLIAAGIGFIAGLLFAPRSGEETRKELRVRTDEAREKAMLKAEQVKGAVRDGYHSVRSGADDLKDQAKDLAGSIRGSADRIGDEAKNTASETRERARSARATAEETAENVRRDARRNTR